MEWRSKVVVVTGASSGIGRRTARDLAALGARVCVAARREERLVEVVAEMGGDGAGHSYVVADVTRRGDTTALARHVSRVYGRCDVLVNSAGLNRPRRFREDDAVDALEQLLATNFLGAVYCTRELLPLLTASAPAHVVNVSSVAGRIAVAGAASYAASKFALAGWSESLAYELADAGIHVGVVEPGPVPTEGFPQTDLLEHRLLSFAVTDVGRVSRAIRETVERGKIERVVPRWYYLLQFPRLVAPPVFRYFMRRIVTQRRAAGG